MKLEKKHILLAVAALAAVALGFGGFSLIKAQQERAEYAKFRPLPTGPVGDGIEAIRDDFVNMYVLRDGNHLALIDAGVSAESVGRELRQANIDPAAVEHIFLTHAHYDHIGALVLFKNARIHIARPELAKLGDKDKAAFPVAPTPFDDGEHLQLGNSTIQALIVPGHTPGSTAYLFNGKTLFTGDTLALENGHVTPFNERFNMNTTLQRESLSKLARLQGITRIATAHYGTSTDYSTAFKGWAP